MVKVLRKYKSYILVVGGSLLMVAFLMPQAIQKLGGDQLSRTYALVEGRKVTVGEIGKAELEYHAMERFSAFVTKQILGIESPDHWFLITKLAESGGFAAQGGDDAQDWPLLESALARQIAESQYREAATYAMQQPQIMNQIIEQARQMLPQLRQRALSETRLDEKEFDAAVSKARAVLRMLETFNRAHVLSDRRALAGEKARYDGASADALIIAAQRLAAGVPEPTDEQLQAHFDRFRPVKRGGGEFGIGYNLPARLKLEWLTVNKAAVSAVVTIDPIEANKRWRTNKDKYKGEFAADRPRVEADLRAEKVSAILTDEDSTIRAELTKAIRRLDPDKTYKKLPADWATQRPSLEKVAEQTAASLRAKHGVEVPLPTVTTRAASWLTRDDIESLEGIGASSVRVGARTIPFADAVFLVKELLPPGQTAGTEFGLQVGITTPDIIPTNSAGDRFYFTVLDTRAESPADSLDEVRTAAITDFKRLNAYQTLVAKAAEYREFVATHDLDALARKIDEDSPPAPAADPAPAKPAPLSVVRNLVFRRDDVYRQNPLSGTGMALSGSETVLNVPAARQAVEKAAQSLDPVTPATQTPAEQRTLTIPLPEGLSLAVVQFTGRVPVTREMVRTAGEQAVQELQKGEIRDLIKENEALYPFSFKKLVERYGFKVERQRTDPSKPQPPEPEPLPIGL